MCWNSILLLSHSLITIGQAMRHNYGNHECGLINNPTLLTVHRLEKILNENEMGKWSFLVATNFTSPSEDFPHMRSTVSVPEGFKYCADSQELYNDSCTVLPIHSDNFSISMSGDFTQSYMGGHSDFNKCYTCYSPISTMSKTLEVPSNLAYSLPNDVCFLASE